MPATYTYNPPPLQNPAGILRADQCDPRRYLAAPSTAPCPVQPLKGLRRTRAAVSYRVFAPVGANLPFTIEGNPSVSPTIVHCSLYIVHCPSYTFSAKEKDSETGLSYFGSRYYSSDLSIWLSVDPQASKYPSLSPYVYCANNPVRVVDPDGEEIVITETTDNNGNKVINIHFTAALVNKSSRFISSEKMELYKSSIETSLKNHYGGSYDDGTTVNVSVDLQIYDKDDLSYCLTDRHNIFIKDHCSDYTKAGMAEEGGRDMELSLAVCDNINDQRVSNMSNTFERTVAHEFGHFLNLAHDKADNNLMNEKTEGTVITTGQNNTALSNFRSNKMNQGNGFFYYQQRMRRRNSLGTPPHKS
ncbi:MAG: RHS repeat-associated core domain-containing protein [Bacteroidales bacterium]|nr:RHS repeat-associated core domain-containing protein [Bacteroidales bacterium]